MTVKYRAVRHCVLCAEAPSAMYQVGAGNHLVCLPCYHQRREEVRRLLDWVDGVGAHVATSGAILKEIG